jgi:hypothetical protein
VRTTHLICAEEELHGGDTQRGHEATEAQHVAGGRPRLVMAVLLAKAQRFGEDQIDPCLREPSAMQGPTDEDTVHARTRTVSACTATTGLVAQLVRMQIAQASRHTFSWINQAAQARQTWAPIQKQASGW